MAQMTWIRQGSHLASPELSAQLRRQGMPQFIFRQFVDSKEGLGANKGESVQFAKTLRINSRGGTLVETNTFPSNEILIIKDSVTVTEYGNAVPYTQKIETLSEFNLRNEYTKGLHDDHVDTLDDAVCDIFKTGEFKAVCTNTATTVFTTNGTATASAGANPSDKNVRQIVNYMKKKLIPKLGSFYIGILATEALGGVYDYLQAIAQYAEPQFRFTSEVGKYYDARLVEDNNYLSNTLNSSYGEGVFFGEEAVTEAVAHPEEIRYWEEDGGRSKKLAWYYIGGYKKTWSLAADDRNSVGTGVERIVHVTSA